ncbi:hypothetical protein ACROYT_G014521 [Oculina patagonica]
MPAGAVQLLQENDCWDIPYSYQHPADLKLMAGSLPDNYNMLHKTYADVKDSVDDVEVDVEIDDEENEEIEWKNEDGDVEEGEIDQEEEMDGIKEEETEARGSQWKISKVVDNRTTYIHIKQALKLILPREYIARCRQKRHWAAKYLPGKAPVDPKHDIIKFSSVALKSVQQGQKVFDIARVEGIQSSKDGSECTSFKLKGDTTMYLTGSPDGCGSCGVAVICAIRDVCNGNTESFTWTYQEAPQLRAGLMLEVLDLHKRP